MANNNAPFGFQPIRTLSGANQFPINNYAITSGLAKNINLGDPVKLVTAASLLGYSAITVADSVTDVYLGVFAGCQYIPSDGSSPVFSKNWVTGTTPLAGSQIKAFVYDDPFTIFKVQMSGALTAADIPKNCNVAVATGTNGVSGYTLDSTLLATTNTLGWRIIRLYNPNLGAGTAGGNEVGTYGVVECQINRSQWANQIATGA